MYPCHKDEATREKGGLAVHTHITHFPYRTCTAIRLMFRCFASGRVALTDTVVKGKSWSERFQKKEKREKKMADDCSPPSLDRPFSFVM